MSASTNDQSTRPPKKTIYKIVNTWGGYEVLADNVAVKKFTSSNAYREALAYIRTAQAAQ